MKSLSSCICLLLLWGSLPDIAAAQSVLDRTPNLSGGWVGRPQILHFNFLHRFRSGEPPTKKVSNVPTLVTSYSLPGRTLIGAKYSSNSDLVSRIPNEWELFGRWAPLTSEGDGPLDAAVTFAYNDAARSADAELSLSLPAGPLRLLGAVRTFSDGYGAGEGRVALGGGAVLRLNDFVALAGDVTTLMDRTDSEKVAWGRAVQVAVPYTPHTLSIQLTNTNTSTLQGASRGGSGTRWGFEFTIPLTVSRFLPRGSTESDTDVAATGIEQNTVYVIIQDLEFGMERISIPVGSRVVWVNRDVVAHTSTSTTSVWGSPLLPPGESWGYTFDTPGEFPFFCVPHPEMTGVVIVEGETP